MSKIAKILLLLAYTVGFFFLIAGVIKLKQHKCGDYPVCVCFPNFPPCKWIGTSK
jgi:hypothetical protein